MDSVVPFTEENYPKGMGFQQDGAPAHTAKHTAEYFMMAGMTLMDWAPSSPDMNCIESCWGMLSLTPYYGGCQFDTVEILCEALVCEM